MAAVLPKQMDVGHVRSHVAGGVLVLILGGVAIGTVLCEILEPYEEVSQRR